MWQLCRALVHLHAHNVVHGDLKLDNFLIKNEILKLADFGLARLVKPNRGLRTSVFVHATCYRYEYQLMTIFQCAVGFVHGGSMLILLLKLFE